MSWKHNKCVIFAATLVLFWSWLSIYSLAAGLYDYEKYSDYLLKTLEGPMSVNNKEMLDYIRDKVLLPPSSLPYNLANYATQHLLEEESEQFYKKYSVELFGFKRNGFFVEAGALDGESMSNTLWLEKHLGWKGLLVEPDPSSFKLLQKKNRKSWLANVCLSTVRFPKKERLTSRDSISSHSYRHDNPRLKAVGFIMDDNANVTLDNLVFSYYTRQCFPLDSLLFALNVTRVDLLSLDVEIIEEQIIRYFDFTQFDIQVIFLEWKEHDKLLWLRSFFEEKGYSFVDNIFGDIIFVKRGSEYESILNVKHPKRKMNIWKTA